MKITLTKPYKSIAEFGAIDIPSFVVITGLNGSGKSHLLEAIRNGSIKVDEIQGAKTVLFNAQTFNLQPEYSVDANKLAEEYNSIIGHAKQRAMAASAAVVSSGVYELAKNICQSRNKSFLDLHADDFSCGEDFQAYVTMRNNYMRSLANFSVKLPNEHTATNYGNVLLGVAGRVRCALHDVDDTELRTMLLTHRINNFLLPTAIGKTFWDWHLKYDNNKYRQYISQSEGRQDVGYCSEEEFFKLYGKKPWEIFNGILESFGSLEYRVNSPEGLCRDEAFHFKLVRKDNPEVKIQFNELSSGERVLMALVGLLYRLRLDNELPDLLLFDEVDSTLHPSMTKALLSIIEGAILSAGAKVILVTHSPSTVALAPEESIFVKEKAGSFLAKASKRDALSLLTEGFASLTGAESVGAISYHLERMAARPVLLTEGLSDRIILEAAWSKLYGIEMPFFVQESFDASFLRNLFMRGDDSNGVFKVGKNNILIALFDFDREGYQCWNGLRKKFSVQISDRPEDGLVCKHPAHNAYAMLLPVPDNERVKAQVLREGGTYQDHSVLTIEHLFYGSQDVSCFFKEVGSVGGGSVVNFAGDKIEFARHVELLSPEAFAGFKNLFEQVLRLVEHA